MTMVCDAVETNFGCNFWTVVRSVRTFALGSIIFVLEIFLKFIGKVTIEMWRQFVLK